MIRRILILILGLSFGPAHAVYLVYEKTEEGYRPIPATIRQEIYNTIQKNSWPSPPMIKEVEENLNKGLKPKTEMNLLATQLEQIKLPPNIGPLALFWIPTTFFQLAVIDSLKSESVRRKTLDLMETYFKVNDDLLNFLPLTDYRTAFTKSTQNNNIEPFLEVLNKYTLHYVNSLNTNKIYEFQDLYSVGGTTSKTNLFREIYLAELRAFLTDSFILFRAAKPVPYASIPSNLPSISSKTLYALDAPIQRADARASINDQKRLCEYTHEGIEKSMHLSLANTFFAGFYEDAGACTPMIFLNAVYQNSQAGGRAKRNEWPEAHNLYALMIKKEDCVQKYRDILYLGYSGPIIDLVFNGEDFHPRTFNLRSAKVVVPRNFEVGQDEETPYILQVCRLVADNAYLLHVEKVIEHKLDETQHPPHESLQVQKNLLTFFEELEEKAQELNGSEFSKDESI